MPKYLITYRKQTGQAVDAPALTTITEMSALTEANLSAFMQEERGKQGTIAKASSIAILYIKELSG